jgi:hypothetical protein
MYQPKNKKYKKKDKQVVSTSQKMLDIYFFLKKIIFLIKTRQITQSLIVSFFFLFDVYSEYIKTKR